MHIQEWSKRIATKVLELYSALREANDSLRVLLPPSASHDVAIFRIREEELDACSLVELNAHIELCHKRRCIVSVKQQSEEMPPEYIGFIDYYHKGILTLRLCLKKPTVDFAKTI